MPRTVCPRSSNSVSRSLARIVVGAVALALAVSASAACGKTKDDIYMEGLKIEGEADRNECKLHFGDGQMMQAISGDRIQRCLRLTEDALEKYDQAASMGMDDVDFKRVYARAQDRKAQLTGMLTQLREMEREQILPPAEE